MLDDYKELCRQSADIIPNWSTMSKNDLCREYLVHKNDSVLQNAYMSAILYKYWNLIGKYYYMSANCATPEECYTWLVDSVCYCVNLAAWENPESSIYKDPNGPDKVINRCMKCARLTYYQFINRKKRKDDFTIQSIEELQELYGNGAPEPYDPEQDYDVSTLIIKEYIRDEFKRKNYFVSFLIHVILSSNVFDMISSSNSKSAELNIRKLCKVLNNITEDDLYAFAIDNEIPLESVINAYDYVKLIPQANMKKKIITTLEQLKHSALVESLVGEKHVN